MSPPSRAVLVTLNFCQWRLSYFEWESQITANLADSMEEEVEGTGNRNNSPQSRKKIGSQDLLFGQSGRGGKEKRKRGRWMVKCNKTAQTETLSLGEIPILKNKLGLSS